MTFLPPPTADAAPRRGPQEQVAALSMPSALVTGEAVVLDLAPASFASRALAWTLDAVATAVPAGLLVWLFTSLAEPADPSAQRAYAVTTLVTLFLVLPVTVETLTRGRSLGKRLTGLRTVRDDGGPIRLRHAFVRALLAVVEIWVSAGSLALICSLANPRGKRIGDLLAGTFVVREGSAYRPAPPPQMPPELQGWAGAADIARIPDQLATAARQFLLRAPRLNPASRDRLARDLAAQVGAYVAPLPPPSIHPELYLAAVLAERRTRDLARLTELAQRRAGRAERRARAGVLSPTATRLAGE